MKLNNLFNLQVFTLQSCDYIVQSHKAHGCSVPSCIKHTGVNEASMSIICVTVNCIKHASRIFFDSTHAVGANGSKKNPACMFNAVFSNSRPIQAAGKSNHESALAPSQFIENYKTCSLFMHRKLWMGGAVVWAFECRFQIVTAGEGRKSLPTFTWEVWGQVPNTGYIH